MEEFAAYPAEIRYRDGRLETGHVQGIDRGADPHYDTLVLLHGPAPLDSNGYYGSKLETRELFSNTPLHEIGYVKDPATGVKICFLPFQPPKAQPAGASR